MSSRQSLVRSLVTRAAIAAVLIFAAGFASAAQFTAGNLAVLRVGGTSTNQAGVTALSAATTAVFIDEYTPAGSYVQSIAVATTTNGANHPLTLGGNAGSEGQIHLSPDGRYIAIVGYDGPVGTTTQLDPLASPVINRTVAILAFDGSVDSRTSLTDFSVGNNARGAFTSDGQSAWVAGADASTGAVRYVASLGATTSVDLTGTALKNARDVAVFNSQLYLSTVKGTSIVEALGTGTPTAQASLTPLPGAALRPDRKVRQAHSSSASLGQARNTPDLTRSTSSIPPTLSPTPRRA